MDLAQMLFGGGGETQLPQAPQMPEGSPLAPPPAPAPEMQMPPPTMAQAAPQAPSEPDFFTKLRSDPAMSQAMMMAASRLMQGQRPGQSAAGMVGDALAIGATAHSMLQENARRAGLEERQVARQERESTARVDSLETETAQKKALFPETQAKLAADVRRLRAAGDKEAAQALIAEYNSDPKRLAEKWNLDVKAANAGIARDNAAAGASAANAALTNEKGKAAKTLNEQNDPNAVLHGTHTGKNAAKQKLDELSTYVKQAYPEMTEQQIAQHVLEMQSTKKGEGVEMLTKLMESEDAAVRKWATEKLATKAGYKADGAGKPTAKPAASGAAPTADAAAWEKARTSVAVGEQYVGPDGRSYTRGK